MTAASEKFRCFIAVPIDDAVIGRLRELQEELAHAVPEHSVRWTSDAQLHLTLKFLGSVPASAMSNLESAFRAACERTLPFSLSARGVGAFPSLRNPKVLWAGIEGDTDTLRTLQARIDKATQSWVEKIENREFHPHLTLGRVRENAGRHARSIGEQAQAFRSPEFGGWRVTEVRLMRSQLSPKGSIYTTLAASRLGRTAEDPPLLPQ